MQSPEIVVTEQLCKVYRGGIKAVDGVSFSVRRGEIFGFLGPNGAGKSTTIAMLITLFPPTAGRATVAGHDVVREPDAVRSRIGYVSQDVAVDETLTGHGNLYFQGRLYHLPPAELDRRKVEVLRMVDLADRAGDLVATYSGGMRKRLDIAGGLIHRPEILFLDEPTLGLDIQTRRRIWEYIKRLRGEEGITVFLTTHYMDEADELCDRVAIIDHGQIKALGSPGELKAHVGGDLVTVSLAATDGDPEGVPSVLAGLPPVSRVTAGSRGPGGDIYHLVVTDGERAVPVIIEALHRSGRRINSLSIKRPSLDDVFLHYTGRELRENEGAEAFRRTRIALRRARGGHGGWRH